LRPAAWVRLSQVRLEYKGAGGRLVEAFGQSLSLIPLLYAGIREGMTGGEDEPEPDGS
jgi:hypothetical protein